MVASGVQGYIKQGKCGMEASRGILRWGRQNGIDQAEEGAGLVEQTSIIFIACPCPASFTQDYCLVGRYLSSPFSITWKKGKISPYPSAALGTNGGHAAL